MEVQFLNRGPKTMDVRGQLAAHILQALRYLGKRRVTPLVVARLRQVTCPENRADLRRAAEGVAEWMKPVLREVIGDEAGWYGYRRPVAGP